MNDVNKVKRYVSSSRFQFTLQQRDTFLTKKWIFMSPNGVTYKCWRHRWFIRFTGSLTTKKRFCFHYHVNTASTTLIRPGINLIRTIEKPITHLIISKICRYSIVVITALQIHHFSNCWNAVKFYKRYRNLWKITLPIRTYSQGYWYASLIFPSFPNDC